MDPTVVAALSRKCAGFYKGSIDGGARLGRFGRQSNKLFHGAVVAAAFGDLVAIASAAWIGVAFDRIEVVLRVSVARHDTGMGELIDDDIPRLGLDILRLNGGIEDRIVIVVAP